MKPFEATFDDNIDGRQEKDMPGQYPAHVSRFTSHIIEKSEYKGQKVFNIDFTLANECNNIEIQRMKKAGIVDGKKKYEKVFIGESNEPDMINAGFMSGKTYRSAGVFLTPNLPTNKRYYNEKYKVFFVKMGIEFPEDNDGRLKLYEVEESDVIGLPAIVDLKSYSYFSKKNGEMNHQLRVTDVLSWNDGTKKEFKKEVDPWDE